MMTELWMLAAGMSIGACGCWMWMVTRVEELPEIDPVEEEALLRVGLLGEHEPAVRAPLHIAEGMRAAKVESMGGALARVTPRDAGFAEAMWMAAGYVGACVEFERLWLELRQKAALKRAERMSQ